MPCVLHKTAKTLIISSNYLLVGEQESRTHQTPRELTGTLSLFKSHLLNLMDSPFVEARVYKSVFHVHSL